VKCACAGMRKRFKYHTKHWCGAGDGAKLQHRIDLRERRVVREAMREAAASLALGMDTDTPLFKACVSLAKLQKKAIRAANK